MALFRAPTLKLWNFALLGSRERERERESCKAEGLWHKDENEATIMGSAPHECNKREMQKLNEKHTNQPAGQ